jgi:hypothetical protein
MNQQWRVLTMMLLSALLLTACKEEEKPKAAAAPVAVVAMPTDPNDTEGWRNYLVGVARGNMEGIRQRPYMYYVPAGDDQATLDQVDHQLANVTDTVGRGILPGNMIAFGSPDSARMADLIVEAFKVARPASMKDVRVLFVGASVDEQRVRDAVTPSAAEFVFVEAK